MILCLVFSTSINNSCPDYAEYNDTIYGSNTEHKPLFTLGLQSTLETGVIPLGVNMLNLDCNPPPDVD